MGDVTFTHYYPIGRTVGFFSLAFLLVCATVLMFVYGFIGVFIIFAFFLCIVATYLGIQTLATRKKYPMSIGPEFLTFFREGKQVQIRAQDLKKIRFNGTGLDKRVSATLADGSTIDIPTLYGMDELRKKLHEYYNLGGQ